MTMLQSLGATVAEAVDRAYEMNKVPAEPVMPYTVYSATPDRPEAYTNDGTHGLRMWRLTLQSYGRDLNGALDFDQRATDAFLDRPVVALGYDCGPALIDVGSAVVRDPDNRGVVGVTTSLTFAATKEST